MRGRVESDMVNCVQVLLLGDKEREDVFVVVSQFLEGNELCKKQIFENDLKNHNLIISLPY